MVIAAVETRDHVIHIRQCTRSAVPLKTGDLGIIATIVATAAYPTTDEMIDIGDIHPGFACIEIGMDGQTHEATLRPGGHAGGGEILIAIHVEDHATPFVAGVDLIDLIVMGSGDPQGVIGSIEDFPGRVHARGAGRGIKGIDLKGLRIVGQRGLRGKVQSSAQARQEKQASKKMSVLHSNWIANEDKVVQ